MKFSLTPTLKHRSFVAVAMTFWDSHDKSICSQIFLPSPYITCFSQHENKGKWSKISQEVQACAEKLVIPNEVKEKLLMVIHFVGWEIFRWLHFHVFQWKLVKTLPNKLFWTSYGTIDKQKTALALVCDETQDIMNRFKLACLYCLEEHVFALWEQLKVNVSKDVFKPSSNFHCGQSVIYCHMRMLAESQYPNYNFWLNPADGMRHALLDDNLVAAMFFLPKLTEQDKSTVNFECINTRLGSIDNFCPISLSMTRSSGDAASTLCLLLRNMNKELQLEVLKSFPMQVLNLFLDWPWQDKFIECYQYVEQFLSEEQFRLLLERIAYKQILGVDDCDCQKLLIKLWFSASINIRQGFFNVPDKASDIISHLYELEYWSILNLLLEQPTPEQRKLVLFNKNLYRMIKKMIHNEKWSALEYFMKICFKSEREKCAFRDGMKEFVHLYGPSRSKFNLLVSGNYERCVGSDGSIEYIAGKKLRKLRERRARRRKAQNARKKLFKLQNQLSKSACKGLQMALKVQK